MKIAETILNALTDPVLVLDKSLRATIGNPALCAVLGIAPERLKGRALHELFIENDKQYPLTALLQDALAEGCSVEDLEVICALPAGTQKILSVSARRVDIDNGLSEMILVELRDVTRARETERKVLELNATLQQRTVELEEMNRELESFTHSASHDLRTPLRLTNKIAYLLVQDHGSQLPAGALEKINMILDSTHQMGKLIEDLLAFSRVSREPMKTRRVDVKQLACEALEELSDQLRGREVNVRIDDLPACRADRALLKQVILNLLANALKFTRHCDQAEIQVGFEQLDGEAAYFVRDNGLGFSMSEAESMFIAFSRLHSASDFEGSGVGLALVKRIVERHAGRIWAEGATNRGATIYFTLGEQV